MKKITVIAFVLFIGLVSTQAQVTVSPGIRGGLNLSRLTNVEGVDSKSDFYAGGFVAIKFNRFFTLQPELSYSRQGANGHTDFFDNNENYIGTEKTKMELNYVTLDAVAKFHFNGGGFHLLAGPSLDFKTSDNFPDYVTNPVGVDFGIIGGIGYSLPNGLTFEARFKQGLIDIYGYDGIEDYNGNGNYDEVILNQVFQFGISYTFKVR